MSLPPLNKRALTVLIKQREHLADTYQECAKAFGHPVRPNPAKALEAISEAIAAIDAEIAERSSPPPPPPPLTGS